MSQRTACSGVCALHDDVCLPAVRGHAAKASQRVTSSQGHDKVPYALLTQHLIAMHPHSDLIRRAGMLFDLVDKHQVSLFRCIQRANSWCLCLVARGQRRWFGIRGRFVLVRLQTHSGPIR